MTRIACVVVATEARRAQVCSRVMPSVFMQGFDDVVLVGDWTPQQWGADLVDAPPAVYQHFNVAPLTCTTTDALIKRDVGTLATDADVLVYLCDDHVLAPGFGAALRAVLDEPWDVIVPNRYTSKWDNYSMTPLNNGEHHGYCGGHGGVFRRHVVTAKPWSAHAHHPNWDALCSAEQRARGARFCFSPRADLSIIDLNPNDPQHELALTR